MMKYNRIECGRLLVLLCALLIGQAVADPINGSFELFDYNDSTDHFDPNGWHTENVVTVSEDFIPIDYDGDKSNWQIDINTGLSSFKGENLLILSSGDYYVGESKASQLLRIQEGDKIEGAYFFGACDYLPYDDWAEIKLVPRNHEGNVIQLAFAGIEMLGDYGSFTGWKKFEHTFTAEEVGSYDLTLYISDGIDTQLASYLIVDSIVVCRNNPEDPPPQKADFNCDCTVDNFDMAIFARDWGFDCNDTELIDANCGCLLGTDLDGNGPVDINDFGIMINDWLTGTRKD
ncbi:MAG: hypothetical protein ABFD79_06800 [Phycisphaerales bacterium]